MASHRPRIPFKLLPADYELAETDDLSTSTSVKAFEKKTIKAAEPSSSAREATPTGHPNTRRASTVAVTKGHKVIAKARQPSTRPGTVKTRKMVEWKECRIVKMHGKGLVEVEWQDGTSTICKSIEVLGKVPLKILHFYETLYLYTFNK